MTIETVSDEMLMALVDGELDARSAADVAAAVRNDPALSQKAEMFAWSRQAAKDTYADILAEPVPAHLIAQVLEEGAEPTRQGRGSVLDFASRRRASPSFALPLAACLALAVGLGGGYLIGGSGSVVPAPSMDLIGSQPLLADALASRLSGSVGPVEIGGVPREMSILGTYEIGGGLCRAFRLGDEDGTGIRGLACDRGTGYGVEMAVRDASSSGAFSPASNTAASSIDAYLEMMDASAPFDHAQEAEALGLDGAK